MLMPWVRIQGAITGFFICSTVISAFFKFCWRKLED